MDFINWNAYHQRINLLFHAIVASTMIPFLWLYLEIDTGKRAEILDDLLITVLFIAICGSLVFSSIFYKRKRLQEEIEKCPGTAELLKKYFKIQLSSYILLEGSAVFATIAFFLSANYLFVVTYILILFIFSINRPTVERAARELRLSKEEKSSLLKGKTLQ